MFKAQKMSLEDFNRVIVNLCDLLLEGAIKIEVLPLGRIWEFDIILIPLNDQAKAIIMEAIKSEPFQELDVQFEAVI